MNRLLQDLRYALRQLRKNPGFTATVVITLALGIGANTAIFCVVNALLLRVLPYRDASHLVYVAELWPHEPIVPGPPSPDFIAWRTRGKTFEQIEAYGQGAGSTLTGIGEPERIEPTNVTSGFLDMLGVRLALGRNFSAEEDRPNGPPVVILGHKFWQDHFVSTTDVIGKSIELDGKASTIIGVLPASFVFPDNNFSSDLLVPLKLDPTPGWNERTFRLLRVMGRPKPRVSAEAMQQEFASIVQSNAAQEPPQFITMRKDMQVTVTPLRQWLSGEVRPLLLILQAVVAMVLLIACLNVASLQIGRAVSRQKEVAVRSSLGATRRRIAGQLFTETLLLSLLGGAAGVGLGTWGLSYLRAFLPENLHLVKTAHIDLTVLAFTMILAIVSGAVTGLAPVGAAYRVNPNEILKEGGGRSPSAGHRRLREVVVIAEVAVAMVLFAGAGILVRSFIHLRTAEVGFDPRNVLTAHLQLSGRKYPTGESGTRFLSQILEHAQALPGVQDAAIASGLPLIGSMSTVGAVVEEKPAPPPGGAPDIPLAQVSASYFHILAIPLIRGRLVSEADREGTPLVVVINQSFAQRFFPGEEAIGKHVKFGSVSKGPWYEIVGIVGNVRQEHLRSEDSPNLYVPYRQYLSGNVFLIFKSTRPDLVSGSQIAKLVHALDPDQPLDDVATMETRLADSIAADRANMELMGIFAGVALALAAIGIFGVIAYFVSRRTHEIGVRMALGAQRRDVLWLVLRPGMVATTIGIGIGLIGAFASTRVLRSSLYGVSPNDPLTLAAVSVVFLFVAFSACYIPARRAAQVDPLVALRYE